MRLRLMLRPTQAPRDQPPWGSFDPLKIAMRNETFLCLWMFAPSTHSLQKGLHMLKVEGNEDIQILPTRLPAILPNEIDLRSGVAKFMPKLREQGSLDI